MASGGGAESGWQTPNTVQSRECWYYDLKAQRMMPYSTTPLPEGEQKRMPYSSTPLTEEERQREGSVPEYSEFDTMRGVSSISGSGYRDPEDGTKCETKDMTLEEGQEGEGTGLSMTEKVSTAGHALKKHHG